MRNYMTIFSAGKSYLIKTKQSQKVDHLAILELKPIEVKGKQKIAISLIAGKLSLRFF